MVRPQVLLCLPALVYLLAALYAGHRGDDQPTGDEPFYLVAAESIVQDADVNLKNNHEKRGTHPAATHCVMREQGWYSFHNVGLSALVALPWAAGGPLGARLMIALCAGLAAPALFQVINAIWQQPRDSLVMALVLSLGMPLVHASSQIYPDLPAGILLLFLAGRAITAETEPRTMGWRAVWAPAALAFLPWLHMKYVGPALVAFGWYALARRWRRSFVDAAALGASMLLLAWYNWFAFGKASGPYMPGALNAGLNSFVVFVGLHFDQAQGLFLQQPLWLLGLVGLAPMWRASRRTGVCWTLLYLAAILPNAMHPMWYGGHSFIGRFGATAVLLWAIPLAFAARSLFASGSRAPTVLAVASLAFQLCLARNWLTAGEGLLYPWDRSELFRPCAWSYNGFVPYRLRDYLPYWQPFVEFWHYPANFAALIVACGLPIYGLCFPRRRRLAWTCLLGTSMAAVLLTAAVPVATPPAVCTGDQLPDWGGLIGHKVGTLRVATDGLDTEGVVGLVHRFFAGPGEYQVAIDYQAQGDAGPVGCVSFYDGNTATTLATLTGEDGPRQQVSLLHIPPGETGKSSSIKVLYSGHGTLSIARLAVERRR